MAILVILISRTDSDFQTDLTQNMMNDSLWKQDNVFIVLYFLFIFLHFIFNIWDLPSTVNSLPTTQNKFVYCFALCLSVRHISLFHAATVSVPVMAEHGKGFQKCFRKQKRVLYVCRIPPSQKKIYMIIRNIKLVCILCILLSGTFCIYENKRRKRCSQRRIIIFDYIMWFK